MDLSEALEAAKTASEPKRKCRVCDFLATRDPDEQAEFAKYSVRAKSYAYPKTLLIEALRLVGFEVGHSTLNRHLKHVDHG